MLKDVLFPIVAVGMLLIAPLSAQIAPTASCDSSTVAEFSPSLEPKARAFLASLKAALLAGDKRKIAGMVQYPLLVNTEKSHRTVRNSAQFLAEYDHLFTLSVRNVIAKQVPECLFANWQGVMIGDGEVWFEEQRDGSIKIKTLNVP